MLKLKNPATVSLLSPTLTNSSHYSLTRGATITSLALLVTGWGVTVVTRRHHKGRSHHYSITIDRWTHCSWKWVVHCHCNPGKYADTGNRGELLYRHKESIHLARIDSWYEDYSPTDWVHFLSRVIRLTFLVTMAVARRQSSAQCAVTTLTSSPGFYQPLQHTETVQWKQ